MYVRIFSNVQINPENIKKNSYKTHKGEELERTKTKVMKNK